LAIREPGRVFGHALIACHALRLNTATPLASLSLLGATSLFLLALLLAK
jgi:hypothetical protein